MYSQYVFLVLVLIWQKMIAQAGHKGEKKYLKWPKWAGLREDKLEVGEKPRRA